MKSQGDSSFPTDGHKAILNKLNSKSKTNRKLTNIENWNKPQHKHRNGTVDLFEVLQPNQQLRSCRAGQLPVNTVPGQA